MYEAIGLEKFLRKVLYVNSLLVLVLVTSLLEWLPNTSLFRVVPVSVLLMTATVSFLGQTALFPKACRLPLIWKIFPDIDGSYDVEIASNWSLIQAREEGRSLQTERDVGNQLFKKNGTLTVTARLFSINIRLEMDDRYSTSDTVVCCLKKDGGGPRPVMSYIYKARVLQPQTSDGGHHFGAARIEIPNQRRIDMLEGIYWTDRNWHLARNTAGRIVLRRRKNPRKGAQR